MNHTKQQMLFIALCLIPSFSMAQNNQSFFEKVEEIKKDLYKISAHELSTILAITPKQIPIITADQLKQEMSSNPSMLVINVLTEKYYKDCHINGSINVPLKELVDRARNWDRSQKIVIYCALDECDAGEKGCILLGCMGFTNVVDYRGGIKEWYQLGYPTQGPAVSEYLHTKSSPSSHKGHEYYPETIVCSNQIRWINKYQTQS